MEDNTKEILENEIKKETKTKNGKGTATSIKLEYNGETYILEYSKRAITIMEDQGFRIGDIDDKPMTSLLLLFKGAFIKNHRTVSEALVEEIYDHCEDVDKMISTLMDMYMEAFEGVRTEDDDTKKANWTIQ